MSDDDSGFAVWVTGPEVASAEAIAGELARRLASRGQPVEVLDAVTALDPAAAGIVAGLLARHGIATVIALPGGRQVRDEARARVGRLIEIYVHGADAGHDYEAPARPEVEIVLPEAVPGAGVERALRTLELLGLVPRDVDRGYSEAEEREVIRRLKAFGYL